MAMSSTAMVARQALAAASQGGHEGGCKSILVIFKSLEFKYSLLLYDNGCILWPWDIYY